MQLNETKPLRYVLITPARDEAAFIRKTLEAMVVQTVLPLRWIIVSDGSTDGTDDLVNEYAGRYDWIELVRMPERKERHFAGKVLAFNAGLERVKHLKHDVIGNLDADSSFERDYIEYLLGKFATNPRLGVTGTDYVEEDWDAPLSQNRFSNIEDVTGQCQLFRRECFEAIGGYQPSKHGGVDLIACLSARMHGWETRVYTDKVLLHHRCQGTAQANKCGVEFSNGRKDYLFGSHLLWETCRAAFRLAKRPFLIGGCLLFAGYCWAMLSGSERTVPRNILEFRRREQWNRLAGIPSKLLFLAAGRRSWISTNHLTALFHIPRMVRLCGNWPRYLLNYFLRRNVPAEYRLRSGVRLIDHTGTLTGTMAVVFVRQEYGPMDGFRTIVDIGAHVGSFAVHAAQSCPSARVYCFEPEKRNFGLLKQNIGINGLEGRIAAFQCAVRSDNGCQNLALRESLLNSFHIVPPNADRQPVNCITLRDIVAAHALETIDLLKLNCEGSEYEILESCSAGELERIANIRLEYHELDGARKNGEALARLLEARGYRIEQFTRYRKSSGFIWATRIAAQEPALAPGRVGWFGSLAGVKLIVGSGVDLLAGIS
jgi:poly-beta-1,6-N-acetyl-D-glucosamine synthase